MWPSVLGVVDRVVVDGVLNCGMEKEDPHQKDEQMMVWFHHLMK